MRYIIILAIMAVSVILPYKSFATDVLPMPNTTDQYGRPLTKASIYHKGKQYLIAVSASREGMARMREVVNTLQNSGINDKANILIFSNMHAAPRFIEGMVKNSFQWEGAPQAWLDWDAKTKELAVPAKTSAVWVYILDKDGNVINKTDATTALNTEDIKALLK